jgi:hypothetical protein
MAKRKSNPPINNVVSTKRICTNSRGDNDEDLMTTIKKGNFNIYNPSQDSENFADLQITNGDPEALFLFYKVFARKVSGSMRLILSGDRDCETITLRGVSNEGIQWLEQFLYCAPQMRGFISPPSHVHDLAILIKKFDFPMIRDYLLIIIQKDCYSWNAFPNGYRIFENYKMNEIAEKILKSAIKNCDKITIENFKLLTKEEMDKFLKSCPSINNNVHFAIRCCLWKENTYGIQIWETLRQEAENNWNSPISYKQFLCKFLKHL